MSKSGCIGFCCLKFAIFSVLLLFGLVFLCGKFKNVRTILSEILIDEVELTEHKCAIRLPYHLNQLIRPPVKSCDFCTSLERVEKVANISPEDFQLNYAYSGVPVVITDATANWSAMNSFTLDYFKLVFGSQTVHAAAGCQFFNYKTQFDNLEDFFDSESVWSNFTQPWYIGWSNCNAETVAKLRTEYQRPYFLPDYSMSTSVDWLFVGTPNFGAHFHVDDVGDPSWQAQLKGSKLWVIRPPPECLYQCGMDRIEVVVNPGETLVLDTNIWHHSTKVVGDTISISLGGEFD